MRTVKNTYKQNDICDDILINYTTFFYANVYTVMPSGA
jgi:hypothetical protein